MTKKWWDIKEPVDSLSRYQIKRWLSQVPHGGIVGNMAVLICYNHKHPEQSLLIVEEIQI